MHSHGYRHWQDILADQRFDLLNHPFKTDAERGRKAAFLNRRFQVHSNSKHSVLCHQHAGGILFNFDI